MRTLVEWQERFFGIRPWKRHSLVLLVAGMVYVAIGISYMVTQPTESRVIALQFALNGAFGWMSLTKWGVVFLFSGIMSVVSSRWPPISETWGYFVLTGLSAGWASFYFVGVVFGDSPASNLSGVLSWGLIGFMWWAISGLVNPDDLIELRAAHLALQTEVDALRRRLDGLE